MTRHGSFWGLAEDKIFTRCFVNAEIKKPIADGTTRGWVFYDGECPFCIRQAARFNRLLRKRRIELLPLQSAYARDLLRLTDAELLNEMRLLTSDNRLLGGADAVIELTRRIWWAWPFFLLVQIPGTKVLLRKGYKWFAERRHCFSGTCPVKRTEKQRQRIPFFETP